MTTHELPPASSPELPNSNVESDTEIIAVSAEALKDGTDNQEPVIPDADKINEAALEQQRQQEHEQKLGVVTDTVLASYQENIQQKYSRLHTLLNERGLRAESFSLYENMKTQMAEETARNLRNPGQKTSPNGTGLLEDMKRMFVKDGSGNIDAPHQPADSDPGVIIEQFLNEKQGQDLTADELVQVQTALRVSAEYGRFALSSWQNDKPLKHYAKLQERLIQLHPELDLAKTGFYVVRETTQQSVAAISLDLDSKPNYHYANPQFDRTRQRMQQLLFQMSRVEAQAFLNEHDITLPDKK